MVEAAEMLGITEHTFRRVVAKDNRNSRTRLKHSTGENRTDHGLQQPDKLNLLSTGGPALA